MRCIELHCGIQKSVLVNTSKSIAKENIVGYVEKLFRFMYLSVFCHVLECVGHASTMQYITCKERYIERCIGCNPMYSVMYWDMFKFGEIPTGLLPVCQSTILISSRPFGNRQFFLFSFLPSCHDHD